MTSRPTGDASGGLATKAFPSCAHRVQHARSVTELRMLGAEVGVETSLHVERAGVDIDRDHVVDLVRRRPPDIDDGFIHGSQLDLATGAAHFIAAMFDQLKSS